MLDQSPVEKSLPLAVDEVIDCLRFRWEVTYELRLVVRRNCLYLQVMWGYLEQQSFPLDERTYRNNLGELLEVVNRLGLASQVRDWLFSTPKKPRIGRALSLKLQADGLLEEFVVGNDL